MLSSLSGYFNFMFNAHLSSEFPYCDGNLIGTKFAHIYFNSWPLDDHDDCILVVQTYKKLHIVIYC